MSAALSATMLAAAGRARRRRWAGLQRSGGGGLFGGDIRGGGGGRPVGPRLRSERPDELAGCLRHKHIDERALLSEGAGDVGSFVGGDAAGDGQSDAPALGWIPTIRGVWTVHG